MTVRPPRVVVAVPAMGSDVEDVYAADEPALQTVPGRLANSSIFHIGFAALAE